MKSSICTQAKAHAAKPSLAVRWGDRSRPLFVEIGWAVKYLKTVHGWITTPWVTEFMVSTMPLMGPT